MLNTEHIALAKSLIANIHEMLERDDQVKAAYQWLDAQIIAKTSLQEDRSLERLIGDWSGLEITAHDVTIAAHLHHRLHGEYPFLYINPGFTFPSTERLRGMSTSFSYNVEERLLLANYQAYEVVTYSSGDDLGIIRNFDRRVLPEAYYDPNNFCAKHDDCTCYYCMFGR